MSRRPIKAEKISDKKRRDELAQLSKQAKIDVQNAKDSVAIYTRQYREIKNNISALDKRYKSAVTDTKIYEDKIKSLKDTYDKLNSEIDVLNDTTVAINKNNTEYSMQVEIVQDRIALEKLKLAEVQKEMKYAVDNRTKLYREVDSMEEKIRSRKARNTELMNRNSLLIRNLEALQDTKRKLVKEIQDRERLLSEHINNNDIKMNNARQELVKVNTQIDKSRTKLKQIKEETDKELALIGAQKKDLEVYRGHNIRLLNELNIKIKEAKAYRDNKIIGEYLTKNGL